MDAKPIIFSGEMVRAILDGHKTQTRRVIKPQFNQTWGAGVRNQDPDYFSVHVDIKEPDGEWRWLRCPYGKAGDILWVRETWAHVDGAIWYAADGIDIPRNDGVKLRPSIHMPRWASRITLEITNVRVERLFDISQEDAKAEGVSIEATRTLTHVGAFAITWDAINKKRGYGWEGGTNPWLWVVEFRRAA